MIISSFVVLSVALLPQNIRVKYMTSPYVDGVNFPITWEYSALDGAQTQSARQVVCSVAGKVVWDSGVINSSEQICAIDTALPAMSTVHTEVRIWNASGIVESGTTTFETTSTKDPFNWLGAQWLARTANTPPKNECVFYDPNPTSLFTATFQNTAGTPARIYLTGLGYYSAWLNGEKLSTKPETYLDPPLSSVAKRVFYNVYNVTELLKNGENTLSIEVGNGWFNPLPLRFWGRVNIRDTMAIGVPMVKAMLKVDGNTIVSSPDTFVVSTTPRIFNNIYLGEVWDGTLSDGSPQPPVVVTPDIGVFEVSPIPPITEQETLSTKMLSQKESSSEVNPDSLIALKNEKLEHQIVVMDSGKNHAGTCRFEVHWGNDVPLGAFVRVFVRYGELLNANGSVNVLTSTAGQIKAANPIAPCQPTVAFQRDEFRFIKTSQTDFFEPRFSWHGMRYMEAFIYTNTSNTSITLQATCKVLQTDLPIALRYNVSDARLDATLKLAENTFASNLMSVQSDCPHRERFGYSGDALAVGEGLLARYDMSAFYTKRVADFMDAVAENGGFTETAPYVGIHDGSVAGNAGPIGWAAYPPAAALWQYRYYGDLNALSIAYPAVRAFATLLERNTSNILDGLGDWMPLEETGTGLTGMYFQFATYHVVADIAKILGDIETYNVFVLKAEGIRSELNTKYLDNASCAYGSKKEGFNATQTGQGLAVYNDIVPEACKVGAFSLLVENLRAAENVTHAGGEGGPGAHMLCGMFGVKWVLGALSENAEQSIALEVVTQTSFPSLHWMTSNSFVNATTIWEAWYVSESTFSHNHPMFGSHYTWFLQHLVGIQTHPSARGMDVVVLRPRPPLLMAQRSPSLTATVSGSYSTVRGIITVSWLLSATTKALHVNISLPANMQAECDLPNMPSLLLGGGLHAFTTTL